jgi:hypothetical protein
MPYITLPAKYIQLLLHRGDLDLLLKHVASATHASRSLFLFDFSLVLYDRSPWSIVLRGSRRLVAYESYALRWDSDCVYSVQWAANKGGERLELLKEYQVVYLK